jgi:hypothetical protein
MSANDEKLMIAVGKSFACAKLDENDINILKEKGILGLVNEVGLNENQARHVMLWCQNECQRRWGSESFNINKNISQYHKSPYSEYSYKGYRT